MEAPRLLRQNSNSDMPPSILSLTSTMRLMIAVACTLCIASIAEAQRPRLLKSKSHRASSQNFTVKADTAQLAQKVASEAERYRKELAIQWLGHELEDWTEKCPIDVEIGLHAGGETSFAFVMDQTGRGTPTSWEMKIFGPPDRVLDAVLPHEVTHTIFATHFGRPLPRWADEGACTTVEHVSERNKNHRMLLDFLTSSPPRGIPFNRMFTMRKYPHDILPLYAQGYSLARFLIDRKGRRYFLDYIGAGLDAETGNDPLRAWDATTKQFYGFDNLSDLQVSWLGWVKNGSQETGQGGRATMVAANNPLPTNSIVNPSLPGATTTQSAIASKNTNPIQSKTFTSNVGDGLGNSVGQNQSQTKSFPSSKAIKSQLNSLEPFKVSNHSNSQSWYAREMNANSDRTATNDRQSFEKPATIFR